LVSSQKNKLVPKFGLKTFPKFGLKTFPKFGLKTKFWEKEKEKERERQGTCGTTKTGTKAGFVEKPRFFYVSTSFCFYSETQPNLLSFVKIMETKHRFMVCKMVEFYELPLFIDLTNFDSKFSRNKIRRQLFPFLRYLFHKKVDVLFANFFHILSTEYQDLEKEFLSFYRFYEIQIQTMYLVNKASQKELFSLSTKLTFESFLVRKLIKNYSNVELNSSQTSVLKNFLKTKETDS
jgi:hypothetical protein